MKKSKYPDINPRFFMGKNNKPISVYLDYDVYESIFKEINELKKKITALKNKKNKKK